MVVEDYFRHRVCKITCKTDIKPFPTAAGKSGVSIGTGFLIESPKIVGDLVIVTNFHVVANATEITASFNGSPPVSVEILTINPQYDLAILKSPELPPECLACDLGKSNTVTEDSKLYAAGFPLGMPELQIQQGRRTGFHISSEDLLLQHGALLNPGNSGGPLAVRDENDGYTVIGINNAIIAGAQGIDFAILVERLVWVLDVFRKTGLKVQRPFELGFSFQHGSDGLRGSLHEFKGGAGVFITKLSKYRPGIGKGVFEQYDYIFNMNGMSISDNGTVLDPRIARVGPIPLHIYMSREEYGAIVELDLFRWESEGYSEQNVEAHLITEPSPGPREVFPPFEGVEFEILSGMVLVDMTLNAQNEFSLATSGKPQVVVVNLLPQGDIAHNHRELVRPGTIIRSLNEHSVQSIADIRRVFTQLWDNKKETVIFRTEENNFVILPLTTLHEDNDVIRTIYGDSTASKSIPHSIASIQRYGFEDELAELEREMHERLGI